MSIPKHVYDPPFNIVRSSHIALGVADLARARAFYEGALGLIVEDEDKNALYLRALEERQHHSLVLTKSRVAEAHNLGFKVGSEDVRVRGRRRGPRREPPARARLRRLRRVC